MLTMKASLEAKEDIEQQAKTWEDNVQIWAGIDLSDRMITTKEITQAGDAPQ